MPPKKKKPKLDWGHKQLKRMIVEDRKNKTPEERAIDTATTEILKARGYATKPGGKGRRPDIIVVLAYQILIDIVIKVMKRQGWTHPKQKRRKK